MPYNRPQAQSGSRSAPTGMAHPFPVGQVAPKPPWRSWLDKPLSGWECTLGWLASTALFVGVVELLGGPSSGDSQLTIGSTWAIAHGQLTCAFPSTNSIAPLYPMLSGGLAGLARIGHSVTFPSGTALGHSCAKAFAAYHAWSLRSSAETSTLRIGYVGWLVLMAGIVAFLRASGRGRRAWEPATLIVVACLPPVWMCVENYFHPQDLLAMGFALAALACARRDAWIWAGILIALAVLSQQFAVLVAVPLLVVAPVHRRVSFVLAAVATAAVGALPLLVASSGRAAHDVLLGTGENTDSGGTLVSELHLQSAPFFLVSRLMPLAFSFLCAAWVVRRLGRAAAIEPAVLVSLVAPSLSIRLVFESSLYGYYFMALAVALFLVDVVRGRIRASLVVWLIVVSVAYVVGPTTSYLVLWRVSWEHTVQQVTSPAVLLLAVLIILLKIVRSGLRRDLLIWIALAAGAVLVWPSSKDPLSQDFTTMYWQLVLVGSGIALATLPLVDRMREPEDPLQPGGRLPDAPAPQAR